jgi:MFS transporter, DHA1 family, multidrug resistance protein
MSIIPDSSTRNAPAADAPLRPPLPQREFVTMMALMMALNALAIDAMLPALPEIARELGAPRPNDQQAIISLYFIGLGLGSLIHGPLADRFGRRQVILWSLAGYVVSALVAGLSWDWPMMLGLRFLHGLCGAAMGVVVTAIVRDRTSGDEMARLMSMIFLIFMVVPIVAPTVGQAVLWVADWRWIFLLLAAMGLLMAAWVFIRLPETLDPADALPISPRVLAQSWRQVAGHRQAMAYMFGSSIAIGANFGFLNSSQQIISEAFGRADIFSYAFACVAAGIAVANYSNARLVLRFGARRVSQTALFGFILLSGVQWLLADTGETLAVFLVVLTLNMSMIGFIGANFSSIAMEPFGHIAGSASSFQNAVRTLVSAVIGAAIGGAYDGTTLPLAKGYLVCGVVALAFVVWGERGKLFTRPNPPRRPIPRG